MKKHWILLKFKLKSVFGKRQSRDFKVKCGHGNAMKFWNIQSSLSIRKRRTTLACNFVDGIPEPKNWQKNSRQKSLRFILRFWSEYSSGRKPAVFADSSRDYLNNACPVILWYIREVVQPFWCQPHKIINTGLDFCLNRLILKSRINWAKQWKDLWKNCSAIFEGLVTDMTGLMSVLIFHK